MFKKALLLLLNIAWAGHMMSQEVKPNIVLFFVDDLGWKDLGCYGGEFIETPFADKLAAEGIKFTDAYASPVCSPTRASLISGQNSARHGIWEVIGVNDRPYAKLQSPPKSIELKENIRSYADVLTEEGYICASVGKWHVGRTPSAHGFVNIDTTITDPTLKTYAELNQGQDAGRITANAIQFIRENRDKPFIISINHHLVHAPLIARRDLIQKYQTKLRQTGIEDIHPTYAAMTQVADESLGMVLDELNKLDLTNNTVVVFYSDNGGLIKDLYLPTTTPLATTNAPLRGQKGSLYEGGIRVPLIIKWPGHVKPQSVSNEMVNSYDLFSTFIEIGGGKIPVEQEIDGVSLVPLIKGDKKVLDREALFWHFPTNQWTRNPASAIRKGKYKLIEHFEDSQIELFDLESDVGETINLAAKKPELARKLLSDLTAWRVRIGAETPIPNPKYDPLRKKELGYHKFLEIE